MGRSISIAVVACLSLAAIAWLFGASNGPTESSWIAAPQISPRPDETGKGSGVRLDEVRAQRTEVDATPREGRRTPSVAPVLPPSPARVRVHGQVLRAGRAVAGYDLAFRDSTAGDEVQWDFTDDDGHFEVELAPASYIVKNDDEGTCAAEVVVPAGSADFRLDIELPPANRRARR